jgi:crotonobetainyl-CoA:carnitine CoA-transferase CaiB-like acyl-CoA transferase
MTRPLSGIRVLDLTHALAGPSATRLLADLGADVVKIEPPGVGDTARRLVPFVFEAMNRGKRSVAVDVRSPDGRDLVRRLAATSDVFVQSQRPGKMAEFGLDRADLAAVNPRLIYASFSGFGHDGPRAHRRGVDAIVQAESGMAALQGSIIGNLSFVDQSAGLALAYAIQGAVLRRERFGEVDQVEVNLLDVAVYLQSAPLAEFSVTGHRHRQEDYTRRFPAVGVYDTADGALFLAAYWERDWPPLCAVLQRPELETDPRFGTLDARVANLEQLQQILAGLLPARTRGEWIELLEARGVMAAPFADYDEVLVDPQLARNGTFQQEVIASGATATFPRVPYRLSEPGASTGAAPEIGADTLAVVGELGLPDATVHDLLARGVLAAPAAEVSA